MRIALHGNVSQSYGASPVIRDVRSRWPSSTTCGETGGQPGGPARRGALRAAVRQKSSRERERGQTVELAVWHTLQDFLSTSFFCYCFVDTFCCTLKLKEPDTGSHSVTCHLTQVNVPHINPSQAGWYSIYLPWKDVRLSWDAGCDLFARSSGRRLTGLVYCVRDKITADMIIIEM